MRNPQSQKEKLLSGLEWFILIVIIIVLSMAVVWALPNTNWAGYVY